MTEEKDEKRQTKKDRRDRQQKTNLILWEGTILMVEEVDKVEVEEAEAEVPEGSVPRRNRQRSSSIHTV